MVGSARLIAQLPDAYRRAGDKPAKDEATAVQALERVAQQAVSAVGAPACGPFGA